MRVLAIDYGEFRTGLAVSDSTGTIASPFAVICEKNFDALIEKIAHTAQENDICEIVVGNPINMNGTKSERGVKCELLAEKLQHLLSDTRVSVTMWDERLTTISANSIINMNNQRKSVRMRKRRENVDAVAAAVILEGYLGYCKNRNSYS